MSWQCQQIALKGAGRCGCAQHWQFSERLRWRPRPRAAARKAARRPGRQQGPGRRHRPVPPRRSRRPGMAGCRSPGHCLSSLRGQAAGLAAVRRAARSLAGRRDRAALRPDIPGRSAARGDQRGAREVPRYLAPGLPRRRDSADSAGGWHRRGHSGARGHDRYRLQRADQRGQAHPSALVVPWSRLLAGFGRGRTRPRPGRELRGRHPRRRRQLRTAQQSVAPTESPEPLASMFKLYVLGALADAVSAGRLSWQQPIALSASLRSLPSGSLQIEPAGTRYTVSQLADLMDFQQRQHRRRRTCCARRPIRRRGAGPADLRARQPGRAVPAHPGDVPA